MKRIFDTIDSNREKIIQLLQEMVRIPSPNCHEGELKRVDSNTRLFICFDGHGHVNF